MSAAEAPDVLELSPLEAVVRKLTYALEMKFEEAWSDLFVPLAVAANRRVCFNKAATALLMHAGKYNGGI